MDNAQRSPADELRIQTQWLEYQSHQLERIRKNTTVTAIAAGLFLAVIAASCIFYMLYFAGVISLTRLLLR